MKGDNKRSAPAPAPRYFDPFSLLRTEMEQLFDRFNGPSFPALSGVLPQMDEGIVMPSMDVRENDKEIVIEAELPGIDEKDVTVTMQNGILTIKGEKKFENEEEKDDYQRIERRYGSFRRSMALPDTVSEDDVAAEFAKGVLTVKLPKKPEAVQEERKIEIASS